jgi:uncharacterized membrane protein
MGFCWNGFGWGGWGGLGTIGLVLSLVFFAAVLVVLGVGTAWLVRRLSRSPLAPAAGADPLEIARRRLAGGEITIAEFEEISDRLQR